MKYLMIFLFTAALLLVSCSGSNDSNNPSLKRGEYSYKLTDSAGTVLVEGTIKIESIKKEVLRNDYSVYGHYTIGSMTSDTSYMGFSTLRAGDFKGYYNDSLKFFNINTNPQIADANVFINTYVKGSDLNGGWSFSTFRSGYLEAGLFRANKVK